MMWLLAAIVLAIAALVYIVWTGLIVNPPR
jgi:hypothetical protein